MNSRDFLSQFRTLMVVGLVTALIWLLAEAESLRTDKARVDVRFHTKPEAPRLVRLEPGQEFTGSVSLTIEGPTAAVDTLQSHLRTPLELEPGMDGVPAEPGRYTVNLVEALRAHPIFRDSNCTITAADPASAVISVDAMITHEVPVKVEAPEGALIEGLPEAAPSSVGVRLSESGAKALGDSPVIARLTPEALQNLPEGRRVVVNGVPLSLPTGIQSEGLRFTFPQVNVALTLRSRTAAAVIPSVPVHLRLAPTEIGTWDIDIPPESRLLSDVTVSGPAELVEQVRTEKLKLIAYVSLSFEELEHAASAGQPIEKEVVFCDLPTPLKFECKQKTIRLTVRRRAPVSTRTPPRGG